MLYKKGNELGISPIKLDNKNSTKQLDELYYHINNILYYFSILYIDKQAQKYILDEIIDVGNRVKDISWPLAKGNRKAELLTKLREKYKEISSNSPIVDDSFFLIVDKMGKFQLSKFIKNKENGLNDEDKLKWLKNNKMFVKIYGYNSSIASISKEILKEFEISDKNS